MNAPTSNCSVRWVHCCLYHYGPTSTLNIYLGPCKLLTCKSDDPVRTSWSFYHFSVQPRACYHYVNTLLPKENIYRSLQEHYTDPFAMLTVKCVKQLWSAVFMTHEGVFSSTEVQCWELWDITLLLSMARQSIKEMSFKWKHVLLLFSSYIWVIVLRAKYIRKQINNCPNSIHC